MKLGAIAAALGLLQAGLAGAQQLELQLPPGPHYQGSPLEIELTADGFEEQPTPDVEVAPPSKGQLDFLGVSPNIQSSITIVNGQMRRSKQVRFVYRYRFVASQPGAVRIGPFRVTQAGVERDVGPVRVDVLQVPQSDRIRVELRVSQEPVYPGERVPTEIEFWLEDELQKNLHRYVLQVPAFEMTESFRFFDADDERATTDVTISGAAGPLELKGRTRTELAGGRRFLVVTVSRTLVPLRAGTSELGSASLVVDEAIRYRRDFFGGRRATQVRKLRAVDRARVLQVKPVPAAGRPATFAGGVGRGFTLEVTADRSVVQVGDPITLSITLRGDGLLETAALPPLDAAGLSPEAGFRVPAAELTGELTQGAKQFSAVVRVLSQDVREIPALSYSWFDPDSGAYATTSSRPIALSVRAAEIVDAEDVVSAPIRDPEALGEKPRPDGGSRRFALTSADLAIERRMPFLLRVPRALWGGIWLPAGIYAVGALAVLIALLDRRRRAIDPALKLRRRGLVREIARIRRAASASDREAAAQVGGALRSMLAAVPEGRSHELDAFLGECDARAFAPESGDEPTGPEFRERALSLAGRLLEVAE